MSDKQMHIDPADFAKLFLQTSDVTNMTEAEIPEKTKKALSAYLSAYYLADRFNRSEQQFFTDKDTQSSIYQTIMRELNEY
ncbi:hypothetical protein [Pediococcus claussenii]|uniref:Uncharacterized protein n=1 Tax=Pediococcus claussenii (strain ATCC BAA-344 / DSM 14800 / JCM 18046 / KCTC 3811 / LMG 21948 / P06) TaxID=701521 RepID=G8PBQ9_PEDCP|nr:hypothetical protein [Pediococcus claussenii]AEV95967.1 hypothetical protein PECL_1753 [Pediococcus claussenii ATCC BAA-344]ANZ69455.1 hypothetical protein AYR57_03640 [Pediococcus claussenii]ANZ71275.1 hypothetical protein AYR58_03655 [Pediococcus claussenii]KRN20573.1 hypothetical protein IV79_GL000632 [Pediococcus claussenii]